MIRLLVNQNEVELSSIGDAILPLVTLKKVWGKTPDFEMLTSDGRVHPKKEDLLHIVENHYLNNVNKKEVDKMVESQSAYEVISDPSDFYSIMPIAPEKVLNKTLQTLYKLGY